MTGYELKHEKFSGPIETLLDLIERKKLEVTEFSLAEVTADFLEYLQKLDASEVSAEHTEGGRETVSPRIIADFVVIASKLLLIKSKSLLPDMVLSQEEEQDIKDLELQLHFYKNFKPAALHIKNLWDAKQFSASRPLMAHRTAFFYPAANSQAKNLLQSISRVFEALEETTKESKTIQAPLVRIEEKIQEILQSLKSGASALTFRAMQKARPRAEIIVLFLALLQLINSHLVHAEQHIQFSDIVFRKQ